MVEVVEYLPSKYNALSSNLSMVKSKQVNEDHAGLAGSWAASLALVHIAGLPQTGLVVQFLAHQSCSQPLGCGGHELYDRLSEALPKLHAAGQAH
jgi:hypothetical protein